MSEVPGGEYGDAWFAERRLTDVEEETSALFAEVASLGRRVVMAAARANHLDNAEATSVLRMLRTGDAEVAAAPATAIAALDKSPVLTPAPASAEIGEATASAEQDVKVGRTPDGRPRSSRAKLPRMRVCVFGSSSSQTPESFLNESRVLGRLLAEGQHVCVNGAGMTGCMGALNDGAIAEKGSVVGVIHKMWVVPENDELHKGLAKVHIADGPTLAERKSRLLDGADAVISLPGGIGTMDELWEVMAERQLGLRSLPIAMVNVDGVYDTLWKALVEMKAAGLLYCDPSEIAYLAPSAEAALEYCAANLAEPAIDGTAAGVNGLAKTSKKPKKPKKPSYNAGIVQGALLGTTLALLGVKFKQPRLAPLAIVALAFWHKKGSPGISAICSSIMTPAVAGTLLLVPPPFGWPYLARATGFFGIYT